MQKRVASLRLCEVKSLPNGQYDLITLSVPLPDFEYAYGLSRLEGGHPAERVIAPESARSCVICCDGEEHFVTDTIESIARRNGLVFLSGEVYCTHAPYFTRSGVVVKRRNVAVRQGAGEDGRAVTAVTLSQVQRLGSYGAEQIVFLTRDHVQAGPQLSRIVWIQPVRDGQLRPNANEV